MRPVLKLAVAVFCLSVSLRVDEDVSSEDDPPAGDAPQGGVETDLASGEEAVALEAKRQAEDAKARAEGKKEAALEYIDKASQEEKQARREYDAVELHEESARINALRQNELLEQMKEEVKGADREVARSQGEAVESQAQEQDAAGRVASMAGRKKKGRRKGALQGLSEAKQEEKDAALAKRRADKVVLDEQEKRRELGEEEEKQQAARESTKNDLFNLREKLFKAKEHIFAKAEDLSQARGDLAKATVAIDKADVARAQAAEDYTTAFRREEQRKLALYDSKKHMLEDSIINEEMAKQAATLRKDYPAANAAVAAQKKFKEQLRVVRRSVHASTEMLGHVKGREESLAGVARKATQLQRNAEEDLLRAKSAEDVAAVNEQRQNVEDASAKKAEAFDDMEEAEAAYKSASAETEQARQYCKKSAEETGKAEAKERLLKRFAEDADNSAALALESDQDPKQIRDAVARKNAANDALLESKQAARMAASNMHFAEQDRNDGRKALSKAFKEEKADKRDMDAEESREVSGLGRLAKKELDIARKNIAQAQQEKKEARDERNTEAIQLQHAEHARLMAESDDASAKAKLRMATADTRDETERVGRALSARNSGDFAAALAARQNAERKELAAEASELIARSNMELEQVMRERMLDRYRMAGKTLAEATEAVRQRFKDYSRAAANNAEQAANEATTAEQREKRETKYYASLLERLRTEKRRSEATMKEGERRYKLLREQLDAAQEAADAKEAVVKKFAKKLDLCREESPTAKAAPRSSLVAEGRSKGPVDTEPSNEDDDDDDAEDKEQEGDEKTESTTAAPRTPAPTMHPAMKTLQHATQKAEDVEATASASGEAVKQELAEQRALHASILQTIADAKSERAAAVSRRQEEERRMLMLQRDSARQDLSAQEAARSEVEGELIAAREAKSKAMSAAVLAHRDMLEELAKAQQAQVAEASAQERALNEDCQEAVAFSQRNPAEQTAAQAGKKKALLERTAAHEEKWKRRKQEQVYMVQMQGEEHKVQDLALLEGETDWKLRELTAQAEHLKQEEAHAEEALEAMTAAQSKEAEESDDYEAGGGGDDGDAKAAKKAPGTTDAKAGKRRSL
eukprot:TRINITY_DN3692_c0_g1_i2.p1 TRINITY_DN3692_c0_g1~~TRINITY_DN3692_c0_g1_i2.p1  ORF type:complete len:1102 (-),score=505.53 TRINITY_DN3692_c0_g1_i2:71-3376(-)